MRSRCCCGVLAALLLVIPMLVHAAWRSEGPFVAAIEEVAVDKTNPDSIYAATSAGGVWRSDDAGQTWTLPGDEMVSRNVRWIEVDPGNPATLWAGIEAREGSGLWRSPDRGKTWASVKVDQFSFALGQRIAFSASNPRLIFVPSTNLHFRSADSGKTWQSFRVPGQDVYAFAIHPQNPNIVYAGGRGSEHNMSRSQDGGKTWRPFGEGLPKDSSIKGLHLSAASPSTLLAHSGFGRLHKSTDGGATWTELELGLRGTEEIYSLEIDPHDPQTLLAATKQGLRKSTNAGATWRSAGAGLGDYLCKGLAFHPQQKGVVYAGTSGTGLFKSIDGGETFEPLGKGMAAGWTEKVYAPSSGMGPIFAQLSVGLFRMDGPASWTEIQAPFSPGETAKIDGIVFDRDSPKRIYAHKASSWWRSDDAGRSWSKGEVPPASMMNMLRGKLSEPQFKSLVQDPADSKIFYAGSWSSRDPGTAVFKTIDGGKAVATGRDRDHEPKRDAPALRRPGQRVRRRRKGRHLPHHRRRQELASRASGRGPGPRRGSDQAGAPVRRDQEGPVPQHRPRRDVECGDPGAQRGRGRSGRRVARRPGLRRDLPRRVSQHGWRHDLDVIHRRPGPHRRPRALDRGRQPGAPVCRNRRRERVFDRAALEPEPVEAGHIFRTLSTLPSSLNSTKPAFST